MSMLMLMGVFVIMMVIVAMFMIVLQMNIELHAGDSGFLAARNVQVIAIEPQLLQLVLELVRINAKIEQRGNEHIAADAAEDVEVKSFHIYVAAVCDRRKLWSSCRGCISP